MKKIIIIFLINCFLLMHVRPLFATSIKDLSDTQKAKIIKDDKIYRTIQGVLWLSVAYTNTQLPNLNEANFDSYTVFFTLFGIYYLFPRNYENTKMLSYSRKHKLRSIRNIGILNILLGLSPYFAGSLWASSYDENLRQGSNIIKTQAYLIWSAGGILILYSLLSRDSSEEFSRNTEINPVIYPNYAGLMISKRF